MPVNLDDLLVRRIRALSHRLDPVATGERARLSPLRDVRAVLFDVYGTLVVSASGEVGGAGAAGTVEALAAALSETGFACRSSGAAQRGAALFFESIREAHETRKAEGVRFPEVDLRVIWRRVLTTLAEDRAVCGTVSEEAVARLSVEYECRVNPVWPMPSAGGTLARLRENGMRLGIVSNAQFFTPLVLAAALGGMPEALGFEPSLCAWSYELLEAKPSLNLFRGVVARLAGDGIAPAQVLYVGNDVRNDIRPASKCGCATALFAGDKRSLRLRPEDDECSGVVPDCVLTDLGQVPAITRRGCGERAIP